MYIQYARSPGSNLSPYICIPNLSMKKIICFAVFLLLSVLTVTADALPRFALKKGEANCMGCHVNPTGGQLRGPGGVSFAINALPMWRRGDSIKYTGEISEGIRLGGDFG